MFFKILISFCIISLLSIIVFVHTHVLFGASDMQFHMKRITEWYQSISHSNLLPLFSFNYFHGSAVMSMYPYLSMLPFVILFRLTSSIVVSYYAFFVFIILLSLIISFLSSLRYSNSVYISYLFSVTYSMSSLFTFKMFTDGDLGVATSLVFLPLVIFGFLDILNGSKNYLKISLGITLMSFCQIAALAIIIILLIGWLLLNILKINKYSLINLIKAAFLSVFLSSIMWIPLLRVSLFNETNTVVKKYLTGFSLKFFIENMSPFAAITVILGVICINKFNRLDKQMYLLSLFVIIISSKLIPWHLITSLPLLNLLNQFQFTFRFLIIPQILLSYVFSKSIFVFLRHSNKLKLWSSLLILGIIMTQILAQSAIVYRKSSLINTCFNNYTEVKMYELNHQPHHGDLFNSNKSMKYFVNGYTTNRDYYPTTSNAVSKYIHNYKGIYDNTHLVDVRHNGYNRFSFNTKNHINKLALPLLHYNNERLRVYLNHKLVHYHTDKNNLITLNNVNSGKNEVRIQYIHNMFLTSLRNVMLLIGLIWLICVCIRHYVDRSNNYKSLIGALK